MYSAKNARIEPFEETIQCYLRSKIMGKSDIATLFKGRYRFGVSKAQNLSFTDQEII